MPFRAVLLDFGGVYTPSPFSIFVDFAAELGPDPPLFPAALRQRGGVAPEQAVFLAASPGKGGAARGLGMHGVLVGEDPGGALAELARLISWGGRSGGGIPPLRRLQRRDALAALAF